MKDQTVGQHLDSFGICWRYYNSWFDVGVFLWLSDTAKIADLPATQLEHINNWRAAYPAADDHSPINHLQLITDDNSF